MSYHNYNQAGGALKINPFIPQWSGGQLTKISASRIDLLPDFSSRLSLQLFRLSDLLGGLNPPSTRVFSEDFPFGQMKTLNVSANTDYTGAIYFVGNSTTNETRIAESTILNGLSSIVMPP